MSIETGQRLPATNFHVMTADGPSEKPSSEVFAGTTVALFAVPGAFTPTCHNNHLPGFLANEAALKAKGVDTIACVAVNDPFVVGSWGKATTAEGTIEMLADSDASFTKAIGMDFDGSAVGLGIRSKRYVMLVKDGEVATLLVEDTPGTAEKSSAEALLAAM